MTPDFRLPARLPCVAGLALIGAMGAAGPAAAQYYYPAPPAPVPGYGPVYGRGYGPPPAYGGPVYGAPVYGAPGMLPPEQVRAIVRTVGFGGVSLPTLQGRTYFVNAVGDMGPVLLAVDAFSGRVSSVGTVIYGMPQYRVQPPAGSTRPPKVAARPPASAPVAKPNPAPAAVAAPSAAPTAPKGPAPGVAIPLAPEATGQSGTELKGGAPVARSTPAAQPTPASPPQAAPASTGAPATPAVSAPTPAPAASTSSPSSPSAPGTAIPLAPTPAPAAATTPAPAPASPQKPAASATPAPAAAPKPAAANTSAATNTPAAANTPAAPARGAVTPEVPAASAN